MTDTVDVKRAYSTMRIKAVDEDRREIRGVASTPGTDRMGDVVLPDGAQFTLPIPLLWQHDHEKPIGEVTQAKVTPDGIEIVAKLARVDAPSQLAARLEEAWASIKSGLVRGLSIGFMPIKYAFLDEGGIEFQQWDWYELSAVTIPANAQASISVVRSLDQGSLAASGKKAARSSTHKARVGAVDLTLNQNRESDMTLAEQRQALADKRKELADAMEAIMAKAAEEGRTLDIEEQDSFDDHQAEIDSIDEHIKRLDAFSRAQARSAAPVEGTTERSAGQSRGRVPVQVKHTEKLEPGVQFARYARVKLLAQVDRAPVEAVAQKLYPQDENLGRIVKDAISAASTLSDAWAGDLITDGGAAFADFVEYLRPRTVLGQVASRLRTLPFDTPVLIQDTGGSGYWVKEGQAKPLTKWSYDRVKLAPLTVAAIAVATKQMLMRANAATDALFRDELARAIGETIDATFIDPAVAPVGDTSPGSILNGVGQTTSSGDASVFGVRCDIGALLNAHNDANLEFDGLFWIMSGRVAIALSQMTNEIGNLAYPTVTPTGGTLAGFPIFVSNYAPTDSHGSVIALVKGSEIYLGDEGGIDVAMSDQASLIMSDSPTMASATTPTAAQMVSMFQTNSVAYRVERFLNWQRRRAEAVAWMKVEWDACEMVSSSS